MYKENKPDMVELSILYLFTMKLGAPFQSVILHFGVLHKHIQYRYLRHQIVYTFYDVVLQIFNCKI